MKILAFLAAVLALAVPQAAAKPGEPSPLLALQEHGSQTALVELDGLTLDPVSRAVTLGAGGTVLARSPSGGRVAVSTGNDSWLRIVDLVRRRAGKYVLLGGYALAGHWAAPNRLVLLVGGNTTDLQVVDTSRSRILRSRTLDGQVVATAETGPYLLVLLSPPDGVGVARLAVVDGLGRVRYVTLRGIEAGWAVDHTTGTVHARVPGLAADPSGARAAVVTASGAGATVDLATLNVRSYASRSLSRARKEVTGTVIHADWFAPKVVAVTGEDGAGDERWTPRGLKLLDTRDWTMRLVDPAVTGTASAGGMLLAFGARWDQELRAWTDGAGLSGFDAAGARQFHLMGSAAIGYLSTAGPFAYVPSTGDGRHFTIVDAVTGAIVGEASTRVPTQIVGAW